MSLESPLPAQVEKDGRLKVQVKAGTWDIEFKARHHGPMKEIAVPPSEAGDEIWAFESRNDLRLVDLTGVPAVDPNQTTLPDDWKSYPAYRVKPGDRIAFGEKRRGDSDPRPDQLNLTRDLWLDFDGKGYTVRDAISGAMAKSSRLEAAKGLKLGRVSVNGKDQLITGLSEGRTGVEIREGQVSVLADSRLEGRSFKIPATGWAHVFQRVTENLHLPPGWRALAVIGADSVPNTWLNRWTLLEIFLVLVVALSFAKLWGKVWGVVAFLGLGLTVTEDGRAPVGLDRRTRRPGLAPFPAGRRVPQAGSVLPRRQSSRLNRDRRALPGRPGAHRPLSVPGAADALSVVGRRFRREVLRRLRDAAGLPAASSARPGNGGARACRGGEGRPGRGCRAGAPGGDAPDGRQQEKNGFVDQSRLPAGREGPDRAGTAAVELAGRANQLVRSGGGGEKGSNSSWFLRA
jgi:hypothetical protein